jgi:predicted DNA-binding protein
MPNKPISIRLDENTVSILDQAAERTGHTRSSYIRQLIRNQENSYNTIFEKLETIEEIALTILGYHIPTVIFKNTKGHHDSNDQT